MHDQPSTAELIAAVRRFIDETAAPNLQGHAAFHAKVASNALAIVERELAVRSDAEAGERDRLAVLLEADPDTPLDVLNRDLCARIRAGEMGANTPGLLAHLKTTTIQQLEVDQPRYSGLAQALETMR